VERRYGGYDLLLFSNDGHEEATNKVDLCDRIGRRALRKIPHVVDTMPARFWPEFEERDGLVAVACGDAVLIAAASTRSATGRVMTGSTRWRRRCGLTVRTDRGRL
jgi:hypothetical protein